VLRGASMCLRQRHLEAWPVQVQDAVDVRLTTHYAVGRSQKQQNFTQSSNGRY